MSEALPASPLSQHTNTSPADSSRSSRSFSNWSLSQLACVQGECRRERTLKPKNPKP